MRLRSLVVTGVAAFLLLLGVQNAGATADPLWTKQYGPVQIGAPTAWQKSTAKGISLAVVDTGVDVDHPDLRANLDLANSYDFTCSDDNPDDVVAEGGGHGTHVTGTIAAVANNNVGVAGVAPDAKVMVMRVGLSGAGCGGASSTGLEEVTLAVNRAVDRGAKAINLSLGEGLDIPGLTNTVTQACERAFTRGSLCVIAAGNSGETKSSGYPYDINAIVVTANTNTGAHASFGQKADTKWSVSAPGVDILNTWPMDDPAHNGYHAIQGTSMAAPHVAGALGVLFGAGMNRSQAIKALLDTAGPARDSAVEGAGLIHMDRALGLETPAEAAGPAAGSGQGTVTRGGGSSSSNRQAAGGGSAAIAPTTTAPTAGRAPRTPGVAFEEGLEGAGTSNDLDAIRLQEASENAANKPFNATGPLVVFSGICTLATIAAAIPRLRSKDAPPLT